MKPAVRLSLRTTLGVALTFFLFYTLQIPSTFRALNTVVILCGITVFQGHLMKQRLLIVWISGLMGMAIDTLFRDAPWLYLPGYMVLVYTTMGLASRSRDAATMTLLVFGYSGSVPTSELLSIDPVVDGFHRTLGVTIGLVVAATMFSFLPLKHRIFAKKIEPLRLGTRDQFYLAVCGAALLVVSSALVKQYGTFMVMTGMSWALSIPFQSRSANLIQLAGLLAGQFTAVAFLSVFSASSNSPALYIASLSVMVGLVVYFCRRRPKLKPAQKFFAMSLLILCAYAFHPLQNLGAVVPVAYTMWLGVAVSTMVFVIFRGLEKVERFLLTPEDARLA